MLRFRCDRVANTLSVTTNRDRASPLLAGSPTEQRLTALHFRSPPQRTYGLLQTRPHGSFAAQPAALKPPGQFRAAPLPHRCRVPSVRAPGQDFHLRSQHPYSAHQGRRCAARFARPFGPSLTAPAQLRWLAMNVAPEGDLRVKTSTSAARSTRARLAKARSRYEDPAQDHNRALTLTTSMPGDPELPAARRTTASPRVHAALTSALGPQEKGRGRKARPWSSRGERHSIQSRFVASRSGSRRDELDALLLGPL